MTFLRILILTLLVAFTTCNKEDGEYSSTGVIYDIGKTMCGCCGGWQIKIEDVTYSFDAVPNGSNLVLTYDKLPITVKLDWELSKSGCKSYNRINVMRIREVE